MQEKTIKSALLGEFVSMDEFLPNFYINNDNVNEFQTYLENGHVAYKPKRKKRQVTDILTWIEAWRAYEKLMTTFHGSHLYIVFSDYMSTIMAYAKKYSWSAVSAFDMRHRASLARTSINFLAIDHILVSTVLDSTAVKLNAQRCRRCRSLDHFENECPFPSPASPASAPKTRTATRTATPNPQTEVCNNFNNLKCAFSNCKRAHICRVCKGELPHPLCIKSGNCARAPP